MENALLIGLSRQMALQRQMDVVANNLANIQTSGYKGERLKFEEFVMPMAEFGDMTGTDGRISFVHDTAQIRDFSEGEMVVTNNPLDIAVHGDGWLVVETPDGDRYTRNGHLKIDAEGRVTTADGHPVLGLGGAIQLAPEEKDLTIAADGTISTNEGEKGRLRIVTLANKDAISKAGNNLYASSEEPQAATNVRVAQGVIEQSNVNAVAELARMIEVQRAYIGTAKLLEGSGELRQRAIEQLGRLPV